MLVFEVPILIKSYPVDGFEIFNLQQYEMTPVEPMCDIGGHTTNLFNELLEQLNKNNKQLLLSIDSRNIQITKKILRVMLAKEICYCMYLLIFMVKLQIR